MTEQKRLNISGRGSLFIFLIAALLFLGACGGSTVKEYRPTEPAHLLILHTNDMHSHFTDQPAFWMKDEIKPRIGGFVALDAFIKKERAAVTSSILLDGGDIMTGTPISEIVVDGVKGGAVLKMMNQLGYDAGTLGNHEFDNGQANIDKYFAITEFPILSANLVRDSVMVTPKGYEIFNINGLKVGVIGLMLEDMFDVVLKAYTEGLTIYPVAETAQSIIDLIDKDTDLIILLTHQGFNEDKKLAAEITGADIIVGGHSHTRLKEPVLENGIIIVQAGGNATNLGRLEVTVQGDTVSEYNGRLIELWVDSVNAVTEMSASVEFYENEINRVYGDTIATLVTAWERTRGDESNVGTWLADMLKREAGADFGVLNSGGIRKNIPAGPVTKLDIKEMLPFHNTLSTFRMTGEEVLKMMKHYADNVLNNRGDRVQFSGISFRYADGTDGPEISNALIGDEEIVPDKLYMGATLDFVLFGQSLQYFGFEPSEPINTGKVFFDLAVEYARQEGNIDTKIGGKIFKLECCD